MNVKYIFCISTGRCGTDYLKSLLGQLEHTEAFHEQKPIMHNEMMREYSNGNTSAVEKEMPNKIKKIKSSKAEIYADTSHIFIKSFGWEIPKHIPQEELGVIVLKRNKGAVVNSTHRVHSGPFTYLGRKWILSPSKNSIVKKPMSVMSYNIHRLILKYYWKMKGFDQQVEKTYPTYFSVKSKELIGWYYDETYALGEKYKTTFPNIRYVEVTLDELNTLEGFEKIINVFNLHSYYDKQSIVPLLGKARNLKEQFNP